MKYFKTYEAYKLGVNGVGSLRNSLTALKRQNINGRYVDPEILAQGIRNEYEAITGEKYEDEVQMSMDNTIADIIGHYKMDGPDFMAAWDKVIKESVNEASRRKVHKAAKQGSYPAVIVVVQDGKVIHQEPVSTPDVAPATFNVMQEKYPKALLHLEDNTGKRLFSESVSAAYNNLEKIFGTDQESMDMFQGIEDKGTVKDMIAFIDEFGDEEMLSRYGIKSTSQVKKLAEFIMGESIVNEKLARGLKPLLTIGSTITKNAGEDALLDLSDKFDRIDDEYAGTIASWLDMAIELMQDGYSGDATKKLKQFNKACKDVLGGKEIGSAFESVNEANDQDRLTYFRKFGIAPNNQPQNAAYIKQVLKPGKFFVDWKDAFELGDVALEFVKQVTSISEFDIIDLKTMKRTGKQLDVKKGQLGNLRTTYGVRVNESYEGDFSDFKYDMEMAVDNIGISPKAIKKVSKKGKGYEVRMSSYMSNEETWKKLGDSFGAKLISFTPGSINIGIYE